MLALVEPCVTSDLSDRPHLGCAMLIAACLAKNEEVTLIKGQTRYLEDMFVNDSDELWGLLQDLKAGDLKRMGIDQFKTSIQAKGLRQFQDELKSLYQYVIVDKYPRHYFDALKIAQFKNLHQIFVKVYFHYLTALNQGRLRIVDRYVSEIIKSNPGYIGFSLGTAFDPLTRTVRRRIKELTDIPIIVGGAPTPFIDLKNVHKAFEEGYFDYLVIGAGESALPSLIEALEDKTEPKGIANVFYRKDGKLRTNDLEAINDLDSLPYPDYSQFDLDLYLTPKRILPLQTARGCSWGKCAFCSHSIIYRGQYKTFAIETVIATIKHLQNTYGCSLFVFHDEELPAGRAKRISEAIVKNDLKEIGIYTYARLAGYSGALLRLMRKAGFTLINWGMESGCQRILDRMNKGTTLFTMRHILIKSSRNAIANLCFILFGFPGETKGEAQQTIEFLKKHAAYIDDIQSSEFIFEPYSPVGKNPGKWGIRCRADGTYSTQSGMNVEDRGALYAQFDTEFQINSIKVTSDKLKFMLPGYNRRMMHFLNSSYRLLPKAALLDCLKKGKLNSIFPIILGEMKKGGNKNILLPINSAETVFINQYFPEKGKVLGGLEEKIFVLCDGTLSIDDICSALYRDFKKMYGKKHIYKKCIDFLRKASSGNWGLFFARSWQSP
jgi:radical SAM superfamily enzyme YgiQ (UPF0313 family)